MNRRPGPLLFALLALVQSCCSGEAPVEPGAPKIVGLAIHPNPISVPAGSRVGLRVVATDSRGTPVDYDKRQLSLVSSDSSVAIPYLGSCVDGNCGLENPDELVAGRPGTATITASLATADGALTSTAAVTVDDVIARVTTVTVNAPASLLVGETIQLVARTEDSAGNPLTGRTVTWASGDPALAVVSQTGLVTGVSTGGPVTITATSELRIGTAAIVVVAPHEPFVAISAGSQHTCALTSVGQAYCWGRNAEGQLGDGSTTSSSVPVPVTGGIAFAAISAGSVLTCGLDRDGAAYCWGDGDGGLLGNGDVSQTADVHPAPVPVSGGLRFSMLNGEPPCGVTRDGVGYCWGGRQGDGTDWDTPGGRSAVPVPIGGGLTLSAVSAIGGVACALTTAGAAYCWGDNLVAQLGNGSIGGQSTVPVAVVGGVGFTALGTSGGATCGLVSGGAAYCWGDNSGFALGVTATSETCPWWNDPPASDPCSPVPLRVGGGISFSTLTVGSGHGCGLDAAGRAYCWGDGWAGVLGNGTQNDSPTPMPVAGGLSFTVLSTGAEHTCGLTAEGVAYCWGGNLYGELGVGPPTGTDCPPPDIGYACLATPAKVAGQR